MSSQKIVLITGANRGVGRAIAETYLSRPNHTVIAPVRDPASETAQSLQSNNTAFGEGSNVILLPYDASNPTSADTAIGTLNSSHPEVKHINTVIACAGSLGHFGAFASAAPKDYIDTFTLNTLGPLSLFHATLPLLKSCDSSTRGKFIAISSAVGSTTFASSTRARFDNAGNPRPGAACYGASKAALNYLTVKMDVEYPDITIGLFTPGPTKTGFGGGDMNWDLIPGAMEVDTVVKGLMEQFDGLKKGEVGDLCLKDWSGKVIPW